MKENITIIVDHEDDVFLLEKFFGNKGFFVSRNVNDVDNSLAVILDKSIIDPSEVVHEIVILIDFKGLDDNLLKYIWQQIGKELRKKTVWIETVFSTINILLSFYLLAPL